MSSQPTVGERADANRAALIWLAATMLKLGHPVRAEILAQVGDGGSSPIRTARCLRDRRGLVLNGRSPVPSLGTIAYHYRTMYETGLIKLDHHEQHRGAVEHVYKLTPRGRRLLEGLLAGPTSV